MQTSEKSTMTFRLELFVNNLPESLDFYRRVLGFTLGQPQPDGYTPMTLGGATVSLNLRSNLPDDHPIQVSAGERLGRGIELVLEVNEIEAVYQQVLAAGWPLSSPLQDQPWGLSDFRVSDPDGYYWRITTHG